MDKEIFKKVLEMDEVKKSPLSHFIVKAYEIVMDRYGGEFNEWYVSIQHINDDSNVKKIELMRVRNNRIDKILVTCDYTFPENKKIISHYKSTIPFRHIKYIDVDSEKIVIVNLSKEQVYYHTTILNTHLEFFENFHKVLIRKFDEYCDVEYNYFKQH